MNLEDYSKYYIQGSDHYLIPKDIFDELFNEMSNWREEVKELKKQLQNISNEFLKYDWKNATQEQVYNQLKSLYESIFKEVKTSKINKTNIR